VNSALTLLQQERPFARLLTASTISGLGDWFNSVAVLSLILTLTHSPLSVAIMLLLRSLPFLVLGAFAGIAADQLSRKAILIGCDLARMLLALSLVLVHREQEMWIAWTASTALVAFTVFFNPARAAIVTQLVAPDHLLEANALQQSSGGLVMALGSLMGGIVTARWGLQVAFVVNAASFLASACLIGTVRVKPMRRQGGLRVDSAETHPLRDIIRGSRVVKVLLVLAVLWPIGGGAINVLLSVYAFDVFDAGDTGVGLLYAALGVGFLISGFLARSIARRGRWVIAAGLTLEGLCHVVVSQAPSIWLACFALLIATLGAGISNACLDTILMRSVPNTAQGRIFALLDSTAAIVMSGSMLLAGALLLHLSPRDIGLASGLILAISGAIAGVLLKTSTSPDHAIKSETAHSPQSPEGLLPVPEPRHWSCDGGTE